MLEDVDDPLFLQLKEAQKSVLAPYFPSNKFNNEGKRVIDGQALIQGAPDLFLGFGKAEGHFYIRQLRDMKGGIAIGPGGVSLKNFPDYARLFGWALALGHARSGDAAMIAGYCGQSNELTEALYAFAKSYAKQNQQDFKVFCRAVENGKLPVASRKVAL